MQIMLYRTCELLSHSSCGPRRIYFSYMPYSCAEVSARAIQAAAAPAQLTLRAGACSLPHPEKLATGGEDAFFISEDTRVIGVADGVGGWRESGIDPGEYSRTLMRVACEFFNSDKAKLSNGNLEETARAALALAHQKTRMPGSSTACVLALNPEQSAISAANLGDSGFVVIRNGTVVFQTPPQLHYFDCPYQLGACPEHVDATNYPSDADTYTFNVMAGDTIVLGTDGLWDNCYLEEIAQLIPDTDEAVDTAAEVLATAAREHAGACIPPF
jgi:protein phosphatase PTC7